MTAVKAGNYTAEFKTTLPGVYSFRIKAEGATQGGSRFTREKTITAGAWTGGDRPPVKTPTDNDGNDRMCKFLECLLSDKVISTRLWKRLEEMGVDVKALKKCLKKEKAKGPIFTSIKKGSIDRFSELMNLEKMKEILADDNFGFLQIVEDKKVVEAILPPKLKAKAKAKTVKTQPYMFVSDEGKPKNTPGKK